MSINLLMLAFFFFVIGILGVLGAASVLSYTDQAELAQTTTVTFASADSVELPDVPPNGLRIHVKGEKPGGTTVYYKIPALGAEAIWAEQVDALRPGEVAEYQPITLLENGESFSYYGRVRLMKEGE